MCTPGFIDGRHYSTYVLEYRRLKREGELDRTEKLLIRIVGATEDEATANGWDDVGPTYYEQLAIIYREKKQLAEEIKILERYEQQARASHTPSARLAERLAELRAKAGKNP